MHEIIGHLDKKRWSFVTVNNSIGLECYLLEIRIKPTNPDYWCCDGIKDRSSIWSRCSVTLHVIFFLHCVSHHTIWVFSFDQNLPFLVRLKPHATHTIKEESKLNILFCSTKTLCSCQKKIWNALRLRLYIQSNRNFKWAIINLLALCKDLEHNRTRKGVILWKSLWKRKVGVFTSHS